MARPDDRIARALREAASKILAMRGPEGLSVRAVAEMARQTTMSVYSRFGGKAGLLDALYQEGFETLAEAQRAIPETDAPLADLERLLLRYRHTALVHASHYALMFGATKGFDPSDTSRARALEIFAHLRGRVQRCLDAGAMKGDADEITHAAFALCHGLVSIELEGFAIEPAERYRNAVRALLRGYG